jgi:bifunctional DNA-binding transcriptional regulator/antitoxin component of YhaV-PrlF toxin-antitoxin module
MKGFRECKTNQERRILMLVQVEGNHKLVLPDSICEELGIFEGDRLNASIKEGRIILQPVSQQESDPQGYRKNGKGRIVMFGTASEAFDEEEFG